MPTEKHFYTIAQFFQAGIVDPVFRPIVWEADKAMTLMKVRVAIEIFIDQIDANLGDTQCAYGLQRLRNGYDYPTGALSGAGDVQVFNFNNGSQSFVRGEDIVYWHLIGAPVYNFVPELELYDPKQHKHSIDEVARPLMGFKMGDRLIFTFNTDTLFNPIDNLVYCFGVVETTWQY